MELPNGVKLALNAWFPKHDILVHRLQTC